MKNYLLFLVFSLISLNAYSQTTISGTVRQQNGGILTGVNIYLQGTCDGGSISACQHQYPGLDQ